MSVAGSAFWDARSLARSDFSTVSGVGHLLHAAEEQQRRSYRVMNNVVLQAQYEAERQAAAEAKRQAHEARLLEIEQVREEEHKERMQAAREAEEHRRRRQEAAQADEEAVREAARQKVMNMETRLDRFAEEKALLAQQHAARAAAVQARREAAAQQSQHLLDSRRAMYEQKQAAAEQLMREKEQLRAIEAEIHAEEDYLRQVARDAAKARADAELQGRVSTFVAKGEAKEAGLVVRRREQEQLQKLKAEEAHARSEYIQLKAREAAEEDATKREQLRARLDAKAARADELAAARAALSEQLARVRHSMSMQEASVRASLELVRRSGAAFVLPPDVHRSLSRLRESAALTGSFSGSTFSVGSGFGSPRPRAASPPPPGYANTRIAALAGPATPTRPRSASTQPRSSVFTVLHAAPAAAAAGPKRPALASPRPMGAPSSPAGPARKRVRPMSASAALLRASRTAPSPSAGTPAARKPAGTIIPGKARVTGSVNEAQRQYTTAGPAGANAVARREEELRQVLREEIDKETERQALLAGVQDGREAARLTAIFVAEREAAKRRILALSAAVHAAASGATGAAPAGAKAGPVASAPAPAGVQRQ